MLLVTHEMGFARRVADTAVFMHEGRIWESGPVEETFRSAQTPELKQFLSSTLKSLSSLPAGSPTVREP